MSPTSRLLVVIVVFSGDVADVFLVAVIQDRSVVGGGDRTAGQDFIWWWIHVVIMKVDRQLFVFI